jgi:hypothetical protein
MNKKNNIIFALKLFIPIVFVISLFIVGINAGVINFEKEKIITGEITASIKINFGDGVTYSEIFKLDNSTVYDLLLRLEQNSDIILETTYWEQFNSYIVDSITYINKKYESDSNSYWAFYVNGSPAMEGANKIFVQNNDIIEWKFEHF